MDNLEAAVCQSCEEPISKDAFFCHHCGVQLRCKNCAFPLVKGANNCISCGQPASGSSQKNNINTFRFRESKQEREYEIAFTNEVGKEIKEVIADLLKDKGSLPGGNLVEKFRIQISPDEAIAEDDAGSALAGEINSEVAQEQNSKLIKDEPENTYPHLNDLEILLDCRENEWLLLFAFYKSEYGTTTFTKDIVWQLYKDKRKTTTRFKNLGTNWKSLFKKYVATVRENEFRITAAGLQKVNGLIRPNESVQRVNHSLRKLNSSAGPRTNISRANPVSRKVLANTIVPNEFDVYKNDYKESLEAFFLRKSPGNGNPNRIVTIAYYITNINHQEYFTEGNIDYAYRILKLTGKPAHLKQVIINLKNERIWFQKVIDKSIAGWRLTRQAEIYVEEKLPSRT